MSLGGKLLSNSLAAVGARLGSTLLGVATFAVLARAVGAEGLGQYRTVLTLLLFAGTIVDFGLYANTLQMLSRPDADRTRILSTVVGLRLFASTLGVGTLAGLTYLLEDDPVIRYGVFIAGVGWVGFQLFDIMRAVFQQQIAQNLNAVAETSGALLTFAGVLVFAQMGGGVAAMLAASSAGLLCTGIIAWILALRLLPFRPLVDRAAWRDLAVTGLPFAGSALLITLHFRVDIVLLSFLREPIDVGLYDAPAKLYELVFMAPYLFGGLLMTLFEQDVAKPQGTLAARLQGAFGVTLLFCTLSFAVFLVHAEPILALLGGEAFVAAGMPLRVLSAAATLAGVSAVLRYGAMALRQQGRMLQTDLASLVVAIALHLVLIPRFGALGAAMGKLGGDAVRASMTIFLLRAQLGSTALKTVLLALAAGAGLAVMLWLVEGTGLFWMLDIALCGAIVLAGVWAVPLTRRLVGHLTAKAG
jgi:O-antigen/teichoic acid export membrane protein